MKSCSRNSRNTVICGWRLKTGHQNFCFWAMKVNFFTGFWKVIKVEMCSDECFFKTCSAAHISLYTVINLYKQVIIFDRWFNWNEDIQTRLNILLTWVTLAYFFIPEVELNETFCNDAIQSSKSLCLYNMWYSIIDLWHRLCVAKTLLFWEGKSKPNWDGEIN